MFADNRGTKHLLGCLLAIGLVFFAWWDSVQHMASIVWRVDTFSHGLMVPLITLALIWSRRARFQHLAVSVDWSGLLLVIAATATWYLGEIAEIRLLGHFALILAVQGMVITFLGRAIYLQTLFPMLFLFLAIPMGDGLVPVMQTLTAESVIMMLSLLGVPYEAEGVLLTLASGTYEVARACAGIKFFFTSVVIGVLLAHLAYRTWKGRLAIMLVAALLPILANALRVLGILLIAEVTDQSFAKGVDHIVYGWGFLSFILLLLIAVAYKFSDVSVDKDVSADQENGKGKLAGAATQAPVLIQFILVGLAVGLPFAAYDLAPQGLGPPGYIAPVVVPPCEGCGYRLLSSGKGPESAIWRGADSEFHFKYRFAADTLKISGGLYCPQRPGSRLVQIGNMPAGRGWGELQGLPREKITSGDWLLEKRIYRRGMQRRAVYIGYIVNTERLVSERSVKFETILERLWRGMSVGAVFAISIPHGKNHAEPDKRVEKFLSTFPLDSFLWTELKSSEKGQNLCAA